MKEIEILTGKRAVDALNAEEGRPTLELVHNLVGGFADDYRALMTPEDQLKIDWQKSVNFCYESMQNLKRKSQVVVIEGRGKPVGFVGYDKIGTDPKTGRSVYEVKHLSVLEEVEGQGLGSKMISTVIEKIQEQDPEADITCVATNEGVTQLFKKFGFQPLPPERYYQMLYSTENISEQDRQIMKWRVNTGVRFFVLPNREA